MKIKIIGSGSAGNHIAHAFSKMPMKIVQTDLNVSALKRSKFEIFKKRYKHWPKNIFQEIEGKKDNQSYDAIIISTPPVSHLRLIKKHLNFSNFFVIEKPICEPNISTLKELSKIIKKNKNKKFLCGYNHRLFPSTLKLKKIIQKNFNKISQIDVNFKENTEGFLKAHYWYKSLSESYLSNTKVGGGSLCEHSHGINLGQYLIGDGTNISLKRKKLIWYKKNQCNYDSSAELVYLSKNKILNIHQNFITFPTEKNIRAYGKNIFIELTYNYKNSDDRLLIIQGKKKKIYLFKKTRADDFKYEAKYIYKCLKKKNTGNILDANSAIKTMAYIKKLI